MNYIGMGAGCWCDTVQVGAGRVTVAPAPPSHPTLTPLQNPLQNPQPSCRSLCHSFLGCPSMCPLFQADNKVCLGPVSPVLTHRERNCWKQGCRIPTHTLSGMS